MVDKNNNYVLGRGEVYLDRFDVNGAKTGERYIGNTPAFSLTMDATTLDHFSSDAGVKEKDKSIVLEVTRTATLTCDNINPDNVATFFFGDKETVTTAPATVTSEDLNAGNGVKLGLYYQLGVSDDNPAGVRDIVYPGVSGTLFVLKKGSTSLVAGTDYTLDAENGLIYIMPTSVTVEDDDVLAGTYSLAASTRDRVISGDQPVPCAIRFIARNPSGANVNYYMPNCQIRPNGDYALKGDDWQVIPFTVDILTAGNQEAIYADGLAANFG